MLFKYLPLLQPELIIISFKYIVAAVNYTILFQSFCKGLSNMEFFATFPVEECQNGDKSLLSNDKIVSAENNCHNKKHKFILGSFLAYRLLVYYIYINELFNRGNALFTIIRTCEQYLIYVIIFCLV